MKLDDSTHLVHLLESSVDSPDLYKEVKKLAWRFYNKRQRARNKRREVDNVKTDESVMVGLNTEVQTEVL